MITLPTNLRIWNISEKFNHDTEHFNYLSKILLVTTFIELLTSLYVAQYIYRVNVSGYIQNIFNIFLGSQSALSKLFFVNNLISKYLKFPLAQLVRNTVSRISILPLFSKTAKLYFDANLLKAGLNSGWWNFEKVFFQQKCTLRLT